MGLMMRPILRPILGPKLLGRLLLVVCLGFTGSASEFVVSKVGHTDEAKSLHIGCGRLEQTPIAKSLGLRLRTQFDKPTLIVVGVQKSGTTSLHFVLRSAKQWCGGSSPEGHFFDDRAFETSQVSPSQLAKYNEFWKDCSGQSTVRYEKTPGYFSTSAAPLRICQTMPHARLLVVLREPVSRAWSSFYQSTGNVLGSVNIPMNADGFHLLASLEMSVVQKCAGGIPTGKPLVDVRSSAEYRVCCEGVVHRTWRLARANSAHSKVPPPKASDLAMCSCPMSERYSCGPYGDQRMMQLRTGLYAPLLRNWYMRFRPEQLLVLFHEELVLDPDAHLRQIVEFTQGSHLARASATRLSLPHSNSALQRAGVSTPMHNRTRHMLEGFYAPYNLQLAKLLGKSLEPWPGTGKVGAHA